MTVIHFLRDPVLPGDTVQQLDVLRTQLLGEVVIKGKWLFCCRELDAI
jgi:hypothetical protein